MITFFGIGKYRIARNTPLTAVAFRDTVLSAPEQLRVRAAQAASAVVRLAGPGFSAAENVPHLRREDPRPDHYLDLYAGEISFPLAPPGSYEVELAIEGRETVGMPQNLWILDADQYKSLLIEELSVSPDDTISDTSAVEALISELLADALGDLLDQGAPGSIPPYSVAVGPSARAFDLPTTMLASVIRALASECRQVSMAGASQNWVFQVKDAGLFLSVSATLARPLSGSTVNALHDPQRNELLLLASLLGDRLEQIAINAQAGKERFGMSLLMLAPAEQSAGA